MAQICQNCKAEILTGQKFCRSCGRPSGEFFGQDSPTQVMQPESAPDPASPSPGYREGYGEGASPQPAPGQAVTSPQYPATSPIYPPQSTVTSMSGNDQRNWFERLSGKIPGYGGYVDKERRRDTDKRQRELLADRLRSFKGPINDVMRDLSTGGRLFEIGPVDHLTKKLDRIENRIRYASYGYSGFFDVVKIQEGQLDAIYQFDLSLMEQIDALETKVNALKSNAGTAEGLKSAASAAEGAIDQLEHTFEGRYNAVNGFGQGPPQHEPAPLFPTQ